MTVIRSPYEVLLTEVLNKGIEKSDRTDTGTISYFGPQARFDLSGGFPLVTTKKVNFRSVALELLWFLRGESNATWLQEQGVRIWDKWTKSDGELGPIYGVQWRSWPTPDGGHIDQIANVMESLRDDPDSRRHLVTAWNPAQINEMRLPPCHITFQFYVVDGKLSCKLYQRSADMFIGVPFNIASYSLLTHMVAQQLNLEPGEFIWSGGDAHIYLNHLPQVKTQLSRESYPSPRLEIVRKPDSIFDYQYEDFRVVNYQHHPAIQGDVAK